MQGCYLPGAKLPRLEIRPDSGRLRSDNPNAHNNIVRVLAPQSKGKTGHPLASLAQDFAGRRLRKS